MKIKLFDKDKLDERQLMIRGNIYYQTVSIISFLMIINIFIKQLANIKWIADDWDYLLILFVGITYCTSKMIYHEIYNLTSKKYLALFIFTGCYGLGFGGLSLYHIIFGPATFIKDNYISINGAFFIFSLMYTTIFIVYVYRVIYNKYRQEEED